NGEAGRAQATGTCHPEEPGTRRRRVRDEGSNLSLVWLRPAERTITVDPSLRGRGPSLIAGDGLLDGHVFRADLFAVDDEVQRVRPLRKPGRPHEMERRVRIAVGRHTIGLLADDRPIGTRPAPNDLAVLRRA